MNIEDSFADESITDAELEITEFDLDTLSEYVEVAVENALNTMPDESAINQVMSQLMQLAFVAGAVWQQDRAVEPTTINVPLTPGAVGVLLSQLLESAE